MTIMTEEQPEAPETVPPPRPSWTQDEGLVVVPARHPGRWILMAVLLLIAVAVLRSVISNPNFQWSVVGQYLFADIILMGLVNTLWLTAVAMILGVVLGIVIAVMRISDNPMISGFARLFLWFFRGTPVLVQLIFWYNLAALYPTYTFGIPYLAPGLLHGSVNDLITPYTAAILGLGLNEAAYMAEIVRAGLLSVDGGQAEAARALGMKRLAAMRRIILPQAMRFIVPPTGNETIGMLKTTSIVSVIALSELLYSAQTIYSRTFQTIPLLLVASIWYLGVTSLLSMAQTRIEHRFSRGHSRRSR
jgi:polar amino acid transport system permease protein